MFNDIIFNGISSGDIRKDKSFLEETEQDIELE